MRPSATGKLPDIAAPKAAGKTDDAKAQTAKTLAAKTTAKSDDAVQPQASDPSVTAAAAAPGDDKPQPTAGDGKDTPARPHDAHPDRPCRGRRRAGAGRRRQCRRGQSGQRRAAADRCHSDHPDRRPAGTRGIGAGKARCGAVPIAGVAIEIASKALDGKNRFEIRLDPPELGRIDVRLDVDKSGQVTIASDCRPPRHPQLLHRDSAGLERALQDAGLKTSDNGLQFSLRDQSMSQQQANTPNASGGAVCRCRRHADAAPAIPT